MKSIVRLASCLLLVFVTVRANIVLQDQKKRGHIVMTDDNIVWKGNLFDQGDSECAEHSVEHVWAYPPHQHHSAHYGGWGHMDHETAAASTSGHWAQPSHAYYAFARPSHYTSAHRSMSPRYMHQSPRTTGSTMMSSESAAYPLIAALFPSPYSSGRAAQSPSYGGSSTDQFGKSDDGSKPNERQSIDDEDGDEAAEQMLTKQLMSELGQDLFL
jgi:hypothetical protein